MQPAIILFDGVCNLCNGAVQFIIQRDPDAYFHFAALQSSVGGALQQAHHLVTERMDSVILIEDEKVYTESDAALQIARHLQGGWRWFGLLRVIPKAMRDPVYRWVARNRYRWFGQQESCMIPTAALRARFLEGE